MINILVILPLFGFAVGMWVGVVATASVWKRNAEAPGPMDWRGQAFKVTHADGREDALDRRINAQFRMTGKGE